MQIIWPPLTQAEEDANLLEDHQKEIKKKGKGDNKCRRSAIQMRSHAKLKMGEKAKRPAETDPEWDPHPGKRPRRQVKNQDQELIESSQSDDSLLYWIQPLIQTKPAQCAGLELEHRIPVWLYCV